MKRKNILLLIMSFLSLTSCVKSNPFEVNGLEIINDQEAVYVSYQATSNLSYASKLTINKTSKVDKRKVYSGAAKQYAEYRNYEEKSEYVFYDNYAYSLNLTNYSLFGNVLDGSYYSEYEISKKEWLNNTSLSSDDYLIYSSLNIKNPNSTNENIKTSSVNSFSNSFDVDIKWRNYSLSFLSDGYKHSDFSYGMKDNKLYAFYQSVNEGLIANPLHPEKQVIIFNEIMRIRSFRKDSKLGWVIDYYAEKNNIYHVTSLTGDIYESPILVEENEKVMNYTYEDKKSASFSFVQQYSKNIFIPYIATYEINEENQINEINRNRMNMPYISSYDENYTYALSYLPLEAGPIYSLIIDDGNEEINYGYNYFSLNDLNIIYNDLSIDNSDKYFKSHFSTKFILITTFDSDGYIVDLQTIFVSADNIL